MRDWILTTLLRMVLPVLCRTWRYEVDGREIFERSVEAPEGVAFALWHARIAPLLWYHRSRGITLIASGHRDGRLLSRIARAWGYRIIEGSSTRGAVGAVRGAVTALRSGGAVAITPDGPRGPARVVKPGIVRVATSAGVPIVPVTAAARWAFRLRSWDGFLLPLPFSRVRVAYGSAIAPQRMVESEVEVEPVRKALEELTARIAFPVSRRPLFRPYRCLAFLTPVYRSATRAVEWSRSRTPRRLALPSVLVGGPTAGGDGKTPVSSAVAAILREAGCLPAVVMRGYGGDEQLVHEALQESIPVLCDSDRFAATLCARGEGRDCVVLDGGLQRTDIVPDVRIAVVDCNHVIDGADLLPRGPWRQPLASLRAADLIVLTYKAASTEQVGRAAGLIRAVTGLEPLVARLQIGRFRTTDGRTEPVEVVESRKVLACAGVARPEAFFRMLEDAGSYVWKMPLGDHHHFPARTRKKMLHLSHFVDYVVVTQKDAVKLHGFADTELTTLLTADLDVHWEDDSRVRLDRMLSRVVLKIGSKERQQKAAALRLAI